MNSGPLVSAIVVNWNGARDLDTCLPSLLSQSYRPLEIIVVDNASTDDSASVANLFGVRWLPLERNLGLAPALNRGAEAATGELLLFLNNDMRFHEGFVAAMVAEMLGCSDIFAVDALQYDWNGEHEVHVATRLTTCDSEGTLCHMLTPGLHMCQKATDKPTPVFMASAANLLARKSMFQLLGGFDERLFFGYEDVELCWRGWMFGWQTVFVPAAKCWHRVSHSTHGATASSLSFRGIEIGRLLMAAKLLPFQYALRTWLRSVAGLARDLALLRRQRVADRLRVFRESFGCFPDLLRERRHIHRVAQTTPSAQLDRLLRLGSERAAGVSSAAHATISRTERAALQSTHEIKGM